MNIRLTQLDGKLPNLALMKLAHWHRAQGDKVHLSRSIYRQMFEDRYDKVYASSIFAFSAHAQRLFSQEWPDGITRGTGTDSKETVEEIIGSEHEFYDYTDYPQFTASIGFTQRGCRLSCKFCVVPKKEGKPRSVNTIAQIWRGNPYPKHLCLLDNDFFGNPEWRDRLAEIKDGGFKVCLNQGINVRLIDDIAAESLAMVDYRDDSFKTKRLYTAWDNLGDERIFFEGVGRLEKAGIPPSHLMAYMLIGYDKRETWERIWHRFNRMVDKGIQPYPMVYDRSRADLLCFQRWVIRGLYRFVGWNEYSRTTKSADSLAAYSENLVRPKLLQISPQMAFDV